MERKTVCCLKWPEVTSLMAYLGCIGFAVALSELPSNGVVAKLIRLRALGMTRGRMSDTSGGKERDVDDSTPGEQPRITVSKNGPYLVSGEVPIAGQTIVKDDAGDSVGWRQGKKHDPKQSCALCRCGKSVNIPFCDGSHAAE